MAGPSPTGLANSIRWFLAYAATIHKSQGSEYPAVVIPLTTQHYPMLQRTVLYTAVTRGKRLVVVIEHFRHHSQKPIQTCLGG